MVLKELFLTLSTLADVVALKELISTVSTLEGCGALERTDF